ncbi:MAG: MBL fold metallo-hydrolase [Planctomycetota bacterium]|nr:MAG: MBL fold metallo-hydrolase [Planctomycetota bacterium]
MLEPSQIQGVREIRVGRFRIRALRDARFALDGGAMFGVVPRTLWQRLTPVNEDHTIPLATTPFLIEDDRHRVVLEPGLGLRWEEKARRMFHIDHGDGHEIGASLAALGVEPETVTHCLMSHLHWDHAGGACGADGEPLFPRAEYWAPASEIHAALHPDHLRRASYREEDVQPLLDHDLLGGFQGEAEPVPGIRMIELGGHSDGVSLILVEDGGQTACFWADVVPTRNHVHLPFIMAYDMNAALSHQVREAWIPRAVEENWTCLLYHDPLFPMVKFVQDGKRYTFEPIYA